MTALRLAAATAVAALIATAGCGGGGGIGGTGSAQGALRLALTDAPACGYDEVNITVDRVRVHASATAADADSGWNELVLSPPRRVNLLTLSNGVLEELGELPLAAGRYSQLRLVLAENSASAPLANGIRPTGGSESALDTPSAQQSGLKLQASIDVAAGEVADLVLDFDACKSVVRRGNSGRFNLKPVVGVIPRREDAGLRVQGQVAAALAHGGTVVSLQAGGVPVKATVPDASGRFVLYPLPAGTYDAVITANGYATAVITGVPVASGTPTQLGSSAAPLLPPATTVPQRLVDGTVNPDTATVRALQSLAGGPTVEIAWAPVATGTGAFDFSLPVAAPVRAAWAAPTLPAFTADASAAGRYTLEAALGTARRTRAIDAQATVPPVSFSFP